MAEEINRIKWGSSGGQVPLLSYDSSNIVSINDNSVIYRDGTFIAKNMSGEEIFVWSLSDPSKPIRQFRNKSGSKDFDPNLGLFNEGYWHDIVQKEKSLPITWDLRNKRGSVSNGAEFVISHEGLDLGISEEGNYEIVSCTLNPFRWNTSETSEGVHTGEVYYFRSEGSYTSLKIPKSLDMSVKLFSTRGSVRGVISYPGLVETGTGSVLLRITDSGLLYI